MRIMFPVGFGHWNITKPLVALLTNYFLERMGNWSPHLARTSLENYIFQGMDPQ